jgi:L-seryl-tRNA(Ser) seleniumtransferase
VGKETIAGTIATLDAWERRDHDGIRARERAALGRWLSALDGIAGIAASVVPDPTGNPLDRLEVLVGPESGFTAAGLANALAAGDPPIVVRGHEAELGFFYLDPCNLHPGEAETVARALEALLRSADRPDGAMAPAGSSAGSVLSWPD